MVRTNTEASSQLPVYAAKRSEDFPAWALVTCPHEDCGETFLVKINVWYKARRYGQHDTLITGRSCPYCFRVGRLPARRSIR